MSQEDSQQFENRKKDHIKWSLDSESQVKNLSLSQVLSLNHHPFPDLDFEEVHLKSSSRFFTHLKPLMVSSMTGGHDHALKINMELMKACENKNWIFAMGSLRRELEEITFKKNPQKKLLEWKTLVDDYKGVILGNLGLAQVVGHPLESIKELCHRLNLSGLYVHLNPLQEVMQLEGTPQFKGGLKSLMALCEGLDIPVFLKETGSGFSRQSLKDLEGLNLGAVDVSGLGGTHWGRVEGLRSQNQKSMRAQAAKTFRNWGVTTYDSLFYFKELFGTESFAEPPTEPLAKSPTEPLAKSLKEPPLKNSLKNSLTNPSKNSLTNPSKNSLKNSFKNSLTNPSKNPLKEPLEELLKEPLKEPLRIKKEPFEVWASGGLRNGLDAAVGYALGAHICGFAKPFMEAALQGKNEIEEKMTLIEFELKTALFCTNSSCILELQKQEGALSWI